MTARIATLLARIAHVGEARTAFGRALLQERYRTLQRQIPLLYGIALVNFIGLFLASRAAGFSPTNPANLLVLFVLIRLVHWVRMLGRMPPPEAILVELRRTFVLSILLSIGFAYSAIELFADTPADRQDLVVLFAGLAAVGCAYGLTTFPAAARMPLLLFALPFAGWLALRADTAHLWVGVSLALIALLTLRLVDLNDEGFVALVRSRTEVENERERAQRAERVAIAEKARVREAADTDSLTGLANRRAFIAALEERLGGTAGAPFGLALLDLDGFKPINDTFGHAAGDAVLIEVAARLRLEAGAGAMAARIGGDEFALVLPCAAEPVLLEAGQRACAALSRPYRIAGREYRISACAGLVAPRPGGTDVTTALSRADAALYDAKARGRGCAALFTPAIEQANRRRIAIERRLRDPSIRDAITLSYQPIFDLATGAVRAFEALARWTDPRLGLVAPSEFIPIAEQINVIEGISDRLLARAAAEAAHWPDALKLSFNLSAVQLCTEGSAGRLLAILAAAGLAPERLLIEVTETAMLADFGAARRNLERLRAAGARIVLDDFGSGFASISYLREMIFDGIKIDGSLLAGVPASADAVRLLKGVLDLAASLRVPCVAEHIECDAQLDLLRELGCRDGQGFALAPPLAPDEARALASARVVPFRGRRRGGKRAA